eukprot:c27474_g1_i1 orf=179-1561(-)
MGDYDYKELQRCEDRDDIVAAYEDGLRKMKRAALLTAGVQRFLGYLGCYVFFWGMMVVLGGFGTQLRTDDIVMVAILICVEHARDCSVLAVSNWMATLKIPVNPSNPKNLKYEDDYPRLLSKIHETGVLVQTVLLLPGLGLPLWRFSNLQLWQVRNVSVILTVFYGIVLMRSLLMLWTLLFCAYFSKFLLPYPSLSLKRYYNEVLHRALQLGLAEADSFDFFAFAFKTLRQDFSRNIQPLTVRKQNEDLIRYIYAHRKGIEVVSQYLQSFDTWEQQAAASMVGFWAHENGISVQTALLSRLLEKLGATQTGWAAANSLSVLAEIHPESVVGARTKDGSLLDIVVHQLDKSNATSLVLLRILVSLFLHKDIVRGLDEERLIDLSAKLRDIFHQSRRQRTRTLAAYALMLLDRLTDEDRSSIGSIDPAQDAYFLSSEKDKLQQLREAVGLGAYHDWDKLEIR